MLAILRTIVLALFVHFTTSQVHATAEENRTEVPFMELGSGINPHDFPLISTKVDAQLVDGIVKATIVQEFKNAHSTPIEATYTFPLSTRAAVHAMEMRIGDRVIQAEIKEREEARKVYQQAKAAKKAASLLEQKRPNVFQSKVANILPNETIRVSITFSELLIPENNNYEWVFPTVVGPRYTGSGDDALADSGDLEWINSPYFETVSATVDEVTSLLEPQFTLNAKVMSTLDFKAFQCPSHQAEIDFTSPKEVHIALDSSSPGFQANRDFIVRFKLVDDKISSGLMTHNGDDENFFLINVQPPARVVPNQIPAREYLFVIDVSGSMHGFPLNTAKKLFEHLSKTLRPIDQFNIQCFSGGSQFLSNQPLPATAANIRRARTMLNNLSGRGGTNLNEALKESLAMSCDNDLSRNVIIITDGYIGADQKTFQIIRDNRRNANIFSFGIGSSVNRHLIEGMAKVGGGEPFVVTQPKEAYRIAEQFAEYISAPVLTNIRMTTNNIELSEVQPAQQNDLFANRPLTITGKWKAKNKKSGFITITGMSGNGESFEQSFEVTNDKSSNMPVLCDLWARETVRELIDFNQASASDDLKKRITNLGLEYELVTPFTSFVAVDKTPRAFQGTAKPVKQPLPLPAGVSASALSPAQQVNNGSIPEPSTSILTLITFLAALSIRRRD